MFAAAFNLFPRRRKPCRADKPFRFPFSFTSASSNTVGHHHTDRSVVLREPMACFFAALGEAY
jgi:hypothetical protein